MLNAEQIMSAIEAEAKSRIAVHPCEHLRASNIGHPCERYLYLLIKNWELQDPHDVGLQHIFDLGNKMEEYVIEKLKASGLEVFTPVQRSWRVENPLITGREDVRIKDPETGDLLPGEIKGLSPFEFDRLNTIEDFYQSKHHYVRAYPSQLLTYMWKFEKEHGFFILANKVNGKIKVIDVPFDWDRADALLKKGERIYKALESGTPPEATDDGSVCSTCSMRMVCTAAHSPAEMQFDDGELEDLIKRKEDLTAAYQEYNKVNDEIKTAVGDREKILAGDYVVTVKTIHKGSYMVKERDERRISVKRL